MDIRMHAFLRDTFHSVQRIPDAFLIFGIQMDVNAASVRRINRDHFSGVVPDFQRQVQPCVPDGNRAAAAEILKVCVCPVVQNNRSVSNQAFRIHSS